MKYTIIFVFTAVILTGSAYWLGANFSARPAAETAEKSSETESDDLAPVPREPVAPLEIDYVGLTDEEAANLADENGVPFRVVERDGEPLTVTRDYRFDRINAVVEDGVVVSFTKETRDATANTETPDRPTADRGVATSTVHDAIVGLSVAEAEAYAEDNNVLFRIGSRNGEPRPLTMDYRPGRITAEVVDGVVVAYSVE